jgi:hypothetical protein
MRSVVQLSLCVQPKILAAFRREARGCESDSIFFEQLFCRRFKKYKLVAGVRKQRGRKKNPPVKENR